MENDKPKFDYINFVYGGGAAVILVAAMFKFLGWDYANEIFHYWTYNRSYCF